jgi:hypothetical protein
MSQSDWRSEYREATAAPHPAVKERVWRSMQAPRPRAAPWRVLLAGAAVALTVAVVSAWPRTSSEQRREDGFAWASTDARLEVQGAELTLSRGAVVVSAWGQPVTVHAGAQAVVVDAAISRVVVAGDRAVVEALEGVVLVDGVAVRPTGPAPALTELHALEASEAPVVRAEAAAELASTERRWDDARQALSVVAASSSLRAEAALLKRGELELRQLHAPAQALGSFDEAERRFPNGSLAQERSLSALEAAVALERWAEVQRRADEFLSRFPSSERAREVRAVRDAAAAQTSAEK